MTRFRKVMLALAVVLLSGGLVLAAIVWILHEPRPAGEAGPEAEALAQNMLVSVNGDAWLATGYVEWTFAGRNQHRWDRRRQLSEVRFGDTRAQLNLNTRQGLAWRGGTKLGGDELTKALEGAYALWINDSYWLNPVPKVFDDGVTRELVRLPDGGSALLASYGKGGLTPGDAYLWFPGADGRPFRWKMWVSIIPVGGTPTTWEGWTQLATGAWISTLHRLGPVELKLEGLSGHPTWREKHDTDPFAPLVEAGLASAAGLAAAEQAEELDAAPENP